MSLGEFALIARYFAPRGRRADVLLGIGDDAAVLDLPSDRRLVVAVDTIVAGVHFPRETEAADVGYRALAVNLSDFAAMGAHPSWMTLSLSMPDAAEAWLAGFVSGLFELAERHDVVLVGGDTVRGPLVVSVQLGGWVEPDRWLTRAGAQPGDLLMISGIPGEASAGLQVLQKPILTGASAAHLRRRFLRPEPRVALGRKLRTIASAAMDVSDGLLADLAKLCAASNCGARLEVDSLPVSAPMRELFAADACLEHALAGGDDYEIIFTVAPAQAAGLTARGAAEPLVTSIGVITAGQGVQCTRGGVPFTPARTGYDHFQSAGQS